MSDSESCNSRNSSGEELSDHEDAVEQSSVVQPYMYEPPAESDYHEEETDEDGIPRATLEARFNKTLATSSWYGYACIVCLYCNILSTADAKSFAHFVHTTTHTY